MANWGHGGGAPVAASGGHLRGRAAFAQYEQQQHYNDDLHGQTRHFSQPPALPLPRHHRADMTPEPRTPPPPAAADPDAMPVFFVIRENGLSPTQPKSGFSSGNDEILERTASGISIARDTEYKCALTELLEDDEAANRVREHMANFRRRSPNSPHERILRSLIHPKTADAEFPIDNTALESIFFAANEMFFQGRLTQRVSWDWSHEASAQYTDRIVGTTALRRASRGRGLETLVVLSSPILRDTRYNRRLLISTFLHELIHSYLFICCGFRARQGGGHTPGFRAIAELIDSWAGHGVLHLADIEADLDRFRVPERAAAAAAVSYHQGSTPVYQSHLEAPHSCTRNYHPLPDVDEAWAARAYAPPLITSPTATAQYPFDLGFEEIRRTADRSAPPMWTGRGPMNVDERDDERYYSY